MLFFGSTTNDRRKLTANQARRQDSVTGRAEINFGGAREVYLCEFENVNQTKKVKTKKKRSSVQKILQILVVVSKFLRFSTDSWAENTNLGVLGFHLHSSSLRPVNPSGHSSHLGGHNFRLGGHGPGMPPPWRRACREPTNRRLILTLMLTVS